MYDAVHVLARGGDPCLPVCHLDHQGVPYRYKLFSAVSCRAAHARSPGLPHGDGAPPLGGDGNAAPLVMYAVFFLIVTY